jgi:hypothetical protein
MWVPPRAAFSSLTRSARAAVRMAGSTAPLPPAVSSSLSSAPVVGVSGSRSPSAAARAVLRRVAAVCGGLSVATGCASGVDQLARSLWPSCRVFEAAGPQGWQLARRSQRCVEHVAAAGGLWLSLPCGPCPAGVAPSASASACFCGGGSGSWASLAYALGQPGCSALVFCPPAAAWSVPPRFGCSRVGASPWCYRPARQGSLF